MLSFALILCSTLTSDPDSMLARMFDGALDSAKDAQGRVFIDRDGSFFHIILHWLRDGSYQLPSTHQQLQALARECDFYQLAGLRAVVASRAPTSPSHADSVQLMKLEVHAALEEYLQSADWKQLTLVGWQKHALELRNSLKAVRMEGALLVQLNAYENELTGVLQRCKPLWDAFCNCHPALRSSCKPATEDAPVMALEQAICKRHDATRKLLAAVSGGTVADPSVSSLNERLSAKFRVDGPKAASFDCTVPISSEAEQECVWCGGPQTGYAMTFIAATACIDEALQVRLPPLTLVGVIDKRQHSQCGSQVLSTSYSTWEEPPNDHWSPLHDQFVLAAWESYVVTTGQRAA
jgi:BTB/POZ domain